MKPCRKCGATEKYARGRCAPCRQAYHKTWNINNPEKRRAYNKTWRAANVARVRATNKAWAAANPAALREKHLNHKYGITTGEFNQLLAVQAYRCLICKQPDPTDIDHDHKTGRIRGILHSGCNTALGLLADDPARLHAAINYLEGKRVSLVE